MLWRAAAASFAVIDRGSVIEAEGAGKAGRKRCLRGTALHRTRSSGRACRSCVNSPQQVLDEALELEGLDFLKQFVQP